MSRKVIALFRRPGVEPPPADRPVAAGVFGRLGLLLLGVALLTAAFAPVNQFYLAWVGLVPWLVVLRHTRSPYSAFFWSWLAGTLFFIANMWWMAAVTVPGMIGLMAILGLYWGYAGIIIWTARLLRPSLPNPLLPWSLIQSPMLRLLLLAAVWTAAAEWFRGTWPWNGLPWLYLGYTQTPALWMCQIADLAGVGGLTFLIAAANGWVALWVLNRLSLNGLRRSLAGIVAMIALVLGYGVYCMHAERLIPGPRLLVVQPNYPQSNDGRKGETPEEMLAFHENTTRAALQHDGNIDLVVWSETMLPPLNDYARQTWHGWNPIGPLIESAAGQTANLAYDFHVGVLSGGEYWGASDLIDGIPEPTNKRNEAYFFDRQGVISQDVYAKIHLVPFGEFIPFQQSLPPLYRLMIHLGPPHMDGYQLSPGSEDELTVFSLARPNGTPTDPPWKFVTPICFEDIDADLCAHMLRPEVTGGTKRADMLVNITNDGWFAANENSQHLQAAIFRSIENRVPTARSVNTGISGFIDPLGRVTHALAARTAGTAVDQLMLDNRVTVFTRTGNAFAKLCAVMTVMVAVLATIVHVRRRRAEHALARQTAALN